MKVLVSGATGVVGWRAVRELVSRGHAVTALARSAEKAERVRASGARAVTIDLFDPVATREAVAGHDAVINLATKIPPMAKAWRAKAWAENDRIRTEGSRNLVDAAIDAGANRYLQESVAFLYADHGDRWIDENEPQIASPFTPSVAAAEANARRFTGAGGTGIVLRFGMFYGADSSHTIDLLGFARHGWLLMPGPPDAYLPMIDLDDAARAVVGALSVSAGVYNVVQDQPPTRAELADAAARTLGREKMRTAPRLFTSLTAKRGPHLVTSQRVSNRRFRHAAGWRPESESVADGLAKTLVEMDAAPSDRRWPLPTADRGVREP